MTLLTTKKPKTAEDGVDESFATSPDGTRLYVRQRAGPSELTTILSDGIVCDGFIYKYLWDDLARSLRVAHWNYRGHGRSALPVDGDRITVEAHGADLDAVRRHLGDPEVVLIGHSFGTQVALEAYRLRPERVKAMVFLCGSFGRVTHTFHGSNILANVLPNLMEFVGRHPKLARGLWSRVPVQAAIKIAAMTGEIDPELVAAEDMAPYFQHVAHVDFAMFLRMLSHAGEHNAEDLLPHIQVPVLVIAGERDSFTPKEISEAMAAAIPDAELVMLPRGTHVAPLEHHELVSLRIDKFLTEKRLL
jgi:pimeloyl-ACP methyl ester carboxylesterase